ncbi:NUDIX domain-containing protein [Flavobacteriaceae bacterium 3-367]|uniref:NUDIX hydrolase n=1 Tax=Eudoraea algarum TaxID=3417568 RepID=UPI0032853874
MSKNPKEVLELLQRGEELFLPHISIDNVIFGYENDSLYVLLLEIVEDKWMLPGGFIERQEPLDQAAVRILNERTGLNKVYLKQFYTFGDPNRSFPTEMEQLFLKIGIPWDKDLWISQRFISVGYYALVHMAMTRPTAGFFSLRHQWFRLDALPELLLDHKEIVEAALQKFRADLQVDPVAFHLLPQKFTMPELHRVYETVLGRQMDRSRFQKKMLGYAVFERLEERREGVPHKRPYLYSYKLPANK